MMVMMTMHAETMIKIRPPECIISKIRLTHSSPDFPRHICLTSSVLLAIMSALVMLMADCSGTFKSGFPVGTFKSGGFTVVVFTAVVSLVGLFTSVTSQ